MSWTRIYLKWYFIDGLPVLMIRKVAGTFAKMAVYPNGNDNRKYVSLNCHLEPLSSRRHLLSGDMSNVLMTWQSHSGDSRAIGTSVDRDIGSNVIMTIISALNNAV